MSRKSFHLAVAFIFSLFFFSYQCQSVQVTVDGPATYCNEDPSVYNIPVLSEADQFYVSRLEQVQVFTRHGSRTTIEPLSNYFSENLVSEYDMSFDCDIKTQSNRFYTNSNSDDDDEYDFLTLRSIYSAGVQKVEGNCEAGQSVDGTLTQMRANGRTLFDGYISSRNNVSSMRLFNESILYNIVTNIESNGYDPRLVVRSTHFERTIASATVLVSSLIKQLYWQYDDKNDILSEEQRQHVETLEFKDKLVLDVVTEEVFSSHYTPAENWKAGSKVYNNLKDIINSETYYDNLWNSKEVVATRKEFARITNRTLSSGSIWGFMPAYCFGISLPFSSSFFDTLVNLGDTYDSWFNQYNTYDSGRNYRHISNQSLKLSHNYTSNLTQRHLAYQLYNTPMRWLISHFISNVTSGASKFGNNVGNAKLNRLVYHSFHDSSIIALLGSLGVYNGKIPIFAEMLVLETYSVSSSVSSRRHSLFPSGFAFRLLRNGKVLQFEGCRSAIALGLSVCDLNVFLEVLQTDLMNLKQWEQFVEDNVGVVSASADVSECGCDRVRREERSELLWNGVWSGVGITLLLFAGGAAGYRVLERKLRNNQIKWGKLQDDDRYELPKMRSAGQKDEMEDDVDDENM